MDNSNKFGVKFPIKKDEASKKGRGRHYSSLFGPDHTFKGRRPKFCSMTLFSTPSQQTPFQTSTIDARYRLELKDIEISSCRTKIRYQYRYQYLRFANSIPITIPILHILHFNTNTNTNTRNFQKGYQYQYQNLRFL